VRILTTFDRARAKTNLSIIYLEIRFSTRYTKTNHGEFYDPSPFNSIVDHLIYAGVSGVSPLERD
jgi:hypothetical protein